MSVMNSKTILRVCKYCGKDFFIQPYRVAKGYGNYCSFPCSRKMCFGTYEERFWKKVDKNGPNGCWLWIGDSRGGYGQFRINGRRIQATHASWQFAGNTNPEGLNILHRCDNPPCVRPNHLFLGTQIDNIEDMIKKGRHVPTNGEKSGMAKLTDEKVVEIRARFSAGNISCSELAKEYGLAYITIHNVIVRKTWFHI